MSRARHILRPGAAALAAAALLAAAGCGGDDPAPTAATATPTATDAHEAEEQHRFQPGHSKAVREYYGDVHDEEETASEFEGFGEPESAFHQPPDPPSGELGDPITLTGTNLGIRMRVTPTRLEHEGDRLTIHLRLANTGVTIYESHIRNTRITTANGRRFRGRWCGEEFPRIEPEAAGRGCLRFRLPADAEPRTLHLALEQVPAAVGGRWSLR